MTLATASITTYGTGAPEAALADAVALYRTVYAEAPYNESEADFSDFADSLPRRAQAPNFRLVIAREHAGAVGFAMGHDLAAGTTWWDGALTPLPPEVTSEYDGRTFAVIELAVLPDYRRQGYAHALHAHLLAGVRAKRATLLVLPDAIAARQAYESWSYSSIGRVQPYSQSPIYEALLLDLAVPLIGPEKVKRDSQ